MELAWCSKCHADVSLAHAVAGLQCPSCGGRLYFLIAEDGRKEFLLAEIERMMRIGNWEDAESILRCCYDLDLISAADFNLSATNLEWRKQCASSAAVLAAAGGMPLAAFREAIVSEYDIYAVEWLLREYRGIRLVPDGGTYIVEVS